MNRLQSLATGLLFAVALVAGCSKEEPPKPAAKAEAPLSVDALLTQARAASTKGDIELAVRLAQSAIVADPARPTSYVALGDIYAEAGQPEYARSFYDAALGIDPVGNTPEDYARLIRADLEKFARAVKISGAVAE